MADREVAGFWTVNGQVSVLRIADIFANATPGRNLLHIYQGGHAPFTTVGLWPHPRVISFRHDPRALSCGGRYGFRQHPAHDRKSSPRDGRGLYSYCP